MKKYIFTGLMMMLLLLILFLTVISCTKAVKLFTFNFLTEEGTIFATSNVLISFEISDEAVHIFQYILDETVPATTTCEEILLEEIEGGEHRLNLSPLETPEASKTLHFMVNLDGPTVTVKTNDREYEIDGNAAPMGRNAIVYWNYDTYDLKTQRIIIYEYASNCGYYLIPDGEGNITKITAYSDNPQDQAWIDFHLNKRSFYVSDRRVVINDVFYNMFEIGKEYRILVQGQSELGTWGNVGSIRFRLDERYQTEDTPIIEFSVTELIAPTEEASGNVKIEFTAKNLKEYCSQTVHNYFQNDTTRNSELMYLQFGLDLLFDGASVTSVTFPHFKQGYDDYNFWHTSYWGLNFSRGFVENSQNMSEGTETLVKFELALDYNALIDEDLYFVIPYNDLYVRDKDNRTIDGIQVDHSIVKLELP